MKTHGNTTAVKRIMVIGADDPCAIHQFFIRYGILADSYRSLNDALPALLRPRGPSLIMVDPSQDTQTLLNAIRELQGDDMPVCIAVDDGVYRAAAQALNSNTESSLEQLLRRAETRTVHLPGGESEPLPEVVRGLDLPYHMGEYTLERVLGKGGLGEVYLATYNGDTNMPSKVALKMMRTPQEELAMMGPVGLRLQQMFSMERKHILSLRHPHIVQAHCDGYADIEGSQEPFFVMDYIDGDNLRKLYTRNPQYSHSDVVHIVEGIARALAYLSHHGIAHRDVKPRNILIEQDTEHPYLIDFGISVKFNEDEAGLTPDSQRMLGANGSNESIQGTPAYISPEVIRGHPASDRSDVYSLGVVAWELLAGHSPFSGSDGYNIMEQAKILGVPRLTPDQAHPELGELIHLMTLPDPRDRIRATDVVNGIQALPKYGLEREAARETSRHDDCTWAQRGSDFLLYARIPN